MAEVSKSYLAQIAERARNSLARIREEQSNTMHRATAIVEVWGSAFAAGWLHGRKGLMPTLFGIPYDLLGALAFHVVGFSGAAKGAADHLHNVANGLGAYYAGGLGAALGQKMRKDAGEYKGVPYTDDEAKALKGQVRTVVAGLPYGQVPYGAMVPQHQTVGLHY